MLILSIALAVFASGMLFWNGVLRSLCVQSISWLREVLIEFDYDASWESEAASIHDRSIPIIQDVGQSTDERFIPYALICCFAVINPLLLFVGVSVPIVNFIVIGGVAFLVVSGLKSHNQYVEIFTEVKATKVVLEAKILYDEQMAKTIQEVMDEDA